jgi:hypothetical protein
MKPTGRRQGSSFAAAKHHFWHQARILCVKPTDDFFFVGFSVTDKAGTEEKFRKGGKISTRNANTSRSESNRPSPTPRQVHLSHAGYTTLDISMVCLGFGQYSAG